MPSSTWTADFEFHPGHLRVRKTGAVVPYRWSTAKEVLDWYWFFASVQAKRVRRALSRTPGPTIAFTPDRPRPWYLVWAVAHLSGARIVDVADTPDITMVFEDATVGQRPELGGRGVTVNAQCLDVSKSHVARVFEDVFGYALAVDPSQWTGDAVEKSEHNGAHDGQIVTCPIKPRGDRVYQRVVDNRDPDEPGEVVDYRCPTVAGDVPVVFIKRRRTENRFANANTSVSLTSPDAVFSDDERAQLKRFAAAMRLDWGGLDVLRDRSDGRIYVVDVNKTDMGPPTALALRDQIRAAQRLAQAFRAAFHPKETTHGG